jgi:hypothetical protein
MIRSTTLTALFFAALAAALAMLQSPSDSDLFWHLSTGEWTLDHGQVLDHDIWSFTRDGTLYSVGSWLGDVVLALAYRAAGWAGIDVLRALLVGIAAFFTARITLRVQPHVSWAALPILGTILVSRMVWGDRPQLFTLALFPLLLDILLAARLRDPRRAQPRGSWPSSSVGSLASPVGRLYLLPPLFVIWANLHNAFVIGIIAVAIVALDAFLERDGAWRRLALITLLCVVASQLNPAGGGAIKRAAAYGALLPGWIVEDRPLDVLSGAGLVFALLLIAAIAAAMLRGREGIASRLGAPLLWPGLIAPFAVAALAIQRETPYACMALAPFVAAMVPEALGRPRVVAPDVPRIAGVTVAAVLAALLVIEAVAAAPREPDLSAYPVAALPALRQISGNLLNEYDWGGYLIRYAPEHRTFIDGRGEALFLPDVLDDFQRVVALAPGYRDVLKRWDIAVALLRPDRPLAAALREDGWRVIASDPRWVLLSRP